VLLEERNGDVIAPGCWVTRTAKEHCIVSKYTNYTEHRGILLHPG